MPDIQLRFHKDMLVLSSPLDAALARQGIDAARDRQYLNLMEPDSIIDALRLEMMAGSQCLVTTTEDITQARLAHLRMDSDAKQLAHAALAIAHEVRPQHILAEIGPCGLPLDPSSKSSLNENRAQYANAARAIEGEEFDAFLVNGFSSIPDLKCALMGVAQVSDKPVFASVTVGDLQNPPLEADSASPSERAIEIEPPFGSFELLDESSVPYVPDMHRASLRAEQWPEALDAMVDLGASVVGFETEEPIEKALAFAKEAVKGTNKPVLTQLRVTRSPVKTIGKNLTPLEDIDEYTPDTITAAAVKLYGVGVQFLRATGISSPAFTGALAATVGGLDVRQRREGLHVR